MDEIFGSPPDDSVNIGPAALLGLPHPQRKVMRVVMRYREVAYAALIQYFEGAAEPEGMTREELDAALLALIETKWLIVLDEGHRFRLGDLEGRGALSEEQSKAGPMPSRRRSGLDRLNSFWDKVGARPEGQPESRKKTQSGRDLFDEPNTPSIRQTPPESSGIKQPQPPKRESRSGISKLFDELATTSESEERKETPVSSGVSRLFDELVRKDEPEGDEPSEN